MAQAIVIAQRENGRIVGLFTNKDDPDANDKEARFHELCTAARITASWVCEAGSVTDIVKRRARLADLVVLMAKEINDDLLAHSARPILVVADEISSLNNALLISRKTAEPGLFVAAYLAEIWKTKLVVLANRQQSAIAAYLDFHEVTALFVESKAKEAAATAVEQRCDLIICGRNGRALESLRQQNRLPLLIC